jgi:hypothetical protein
MAQRPSLRPAHEASADDNGTDPELRDLPRAPRTARVLTLGVLALTTVASLALAWALLPDARFALRGAAPENVGALASFRPGDEEQASSGLWVRGTGALTERAIRYRRPLDGDSYRLAPIEGNERIWVQVRIPEGMAEEHFVPPASFVGRLVPLEEANLRYGRLRGALRQLGADPERAWLLVDGEAPATTRWALALVGLFAGFAAFCSFGLVRLTRPVRDAVEARVEPRSVA